MVDAGRGVSFFRQVRVLPREVLLLPCVCQGEVMTDRADGLDLGARDLHNSGVGPRGGGRERGGYY